MARAVQERRILVSIDTDFGELLVQQKAATPSVLLFRKGQHDPKLISEVLLANLSEAATDLESGAIVVITNSRMKIRRLPISSN